MAGGFVLAVMAIPWYTHTTRTNARTHAHTHTHTHTHTHSTYSVLQVLTRAQAHLESESSKKMIELGNYIAYAHNFDDQNAP